MAKSDHDTDDWVKYVEFTDRSVRKAIRALFDPTFLRGYKITDLIQRSGQIGKPDEWAVRLEKDPVGFVERSTSTIIGLSLEDARLIVAGLSKLERTEPVLRLIGEIVQEFQPWELET